MRALLGVLGSAGTSTGTGPQPTLDDLPELVERVRASGLPIVLRTGGTPQPMDRAAHLAACRLVQEALTNVVKHAGPDAAAEVVLTWTSGSVRLEVSGAGPDGVPAVGRGLAGMRERLQLVGGRLREGPGRSGGFAVTAEIPTGTGRRLPGDRP